MPQFAANMDLSSLNGTNGFTLNGVNAGDVSGASVSSAGDINGDGFDDIIIGAFGADPAGNSYAGESYVVFGKAGGFGAAIDLADLNGAKGFKLSVIDRNDFSGAQVSAAGDINDDGFTDIIIGAPGGDPGGDSAAGESYVVFGKAAGFAATLDLASLDGTNGFRLNGIDAGDLCGAVSAAGDVNGDGVDDLIIGASDADQQGDSLAGESYVVFGKASGFAASLELANLNGTNGFRINGSSGLSGGHVSSAGDVNGDGFDDVLIGAEATPGTGTFVAGSSYVVFGKSGGFAPAIDLADLDGTNGFRLDGSNVYDRVGNDVASAGDINGDGFADIIIGAITADVDGHNAAGKSYVVFGKPSGFASSIVLESLDGSDGFRLEGIDTGDYSGHSVAGAGDVNGDGFDDIIIGAIHADPGGDSNAGESYVVFGKSGGFGEAVDLSALDGSNGFRLDGINSGDFSGTSVAAAGDVNGDGFADIIIGAPGDDPRFSGLSNPNAAGESYIVFGHRALTSVIITGTDIAQTSNGGYRADTISGFGGDDRLIGWEGADSVIGGAGADVILGGSGADFLSGGIGADSLQGDDGTDVLRGNDGNDTLVGGMKRDTLVGGEGDDTFRYGALNERGDTITDFEGASLAGGDEIDFSAIDAVAGGSDDAFLFGGTTITAHGVWYRVSTNKVTVFFDSDGDTANAEMAVFLNGVTSLIQSDFVL